MIEFTVPIEIDRPVAEVFAYVTDPAKLHTWQTNTVSAEQQTDGPLGVGTRLREVHRAPGGRKLESLVEISRYEPGRAFALRIVDGPLPINGNFEFSPTGNSTMIEFHASGQPTGGLRLAQPLLRRVLPRQFARDLENLKRVLENPPSQRVN